jgi:hypothetical protein
VSDVSDDFGEARQRHAMEAEGVGAALADLYRRLGVDDPDVGLVDEIVSRWHERMTLAFELFAVLAD